MRFLLIPVILNIVQIQAQFKSVYVDTLLADKLEIRAIAIDGSRIWYAADKGKYGLIDTQTRVKMSRRIMSDSLRPEFRSIAMTEHFAFVLSIGNPALLYKIDKSTLEPEIVYGEKGSKVFYDSMAFWNNDQGIAIGDPVDECLSIITTDDGGNTWKKMSCTIFPKSADGEAAFAASNTNIVIRGNNTWIISGGKMSRIYQSTDRGRSWAAYKLPLVQESETTGAYSADFYDALNGIVVGGRYDKAQERIRNKALTNDGGKTWKLISNGSGFGYGSCVQYVPQSNGKSLVCVGATGVFQSSDSGESWHKILDDQSLYTIRFVDATTAIAAGHNKIIRLRFGY